ncbi:hypothetical protein SAMN04487886_100719 [Clostridium sp. DSM 8431]|uniref:hypothetical protein n=1 Tax=Clostridium sp. DSM 8431 TaxID=1761781 RepID=UPI0008E1DD3B|nr:hypothetical protein [Clostridium sp. DSM 8431]SFU32613.1 hypothetical protein SAMN04487886_100719 [Clostridium sp. DSM 8431]
MKKEELELLPEGLVTCILNDREVRILKISTSEIEVRLAEKEEIQSIKLCFYNFHKYEYDKIEINNYKIIDTKEERFYYIYTIAIEDVDFSYNVKRIFKDYSRYIMLKNYGEENEFSEDMTGYPKDKDLDFYEFYIDQKKDWMKDLKYNKNIDRNIELAVKIDNYTLYNKYLENDIKSFMKYYYEENYISDSGIFNKEVKRIYFGNEFCHNLFPKEDLLLRLIEKAYAENLNVTLCFTYMRERYIEKTKNILEKVYDLCRKNNRKIEIIINDWGILSILEDKKDYFSISLGVLLNKRKKDPRYVYKNGYKENKGLMAQNSLNSSMFSDFLKSLGIERYEYEACGYDIEIAKKSSSLHMPFYVTNISQYCTLNATLQTGKRGKQKLVKCCKKYCTDYVFMYPKHLKMIGRYNSLFAFDDTLLKNSQKLISYIDNGVDRIVLNFI